MIEQQSRCKETTDVSWASRFTQVRKGDRWRCTRCGSCCHTDFEDQWLNFINLSKNTPLAPNWCPHLSIQNSRPHCKIYTDRSNTCRAFPFSLRKGADGRYVLVIHKKCTGFGRGRPINLRRKIVGCVRLANREFNSEITVDFTDFEQMESVLLNRKKRKKKREEKLSS